MADDRVTLDPWFTDAEIADMTRPLTQPAAQQRRLRAMGIRAERRPDGTVLVMRAWLADSANDSAQSKPRLKSDRQAA